jgi:hypothetical protein
MEACGTGAEDLRVMFRMPAAKVAYAKPGEAAAGRRGLDSTASPENGCIVFMRKPRFPAKAATFAPTALLCSQGV